MYFEEEEDEPKRVERETKKMQSSSYLEPLPFEPLLLLLLLAKIEGTVVSNLLLLVAEDMEELVNRLRSFNSTSF